jgi:hypothetical protein
MTPRETTESILFHSMLDDIRLISSNVNDMKADLLIVKKDISNIWREIKHMKNTGSHEIPAFDSTLKIFICKYLPIIVSSLLVGAAAIGATLIR